jgi:hypothetical protein
MPPDGIRRFDGTERLVPEPGIHGTQRLVNLEMVRYRKPSSCTRNSWYCPGKQEILYVKVEFCVHQRF